MKAGWTKLVLAVWLTGLFSFALYDGGWKVCLGLVWFLGFTALLAYQAGRGDDAWM